MELGAGRRGTDTRPRALRLAPRGPAPAAPGHTLAGLGNVNVSQAEAGERLMPGSDSARFMSHIIEACSLAHAELLGLAQETLPLVLGGDHSVALATVSAAFRGPAACQAVVWIDAHADLNTPESSPSGKVHGMTVAMLIGLGESCAVSIWGGGPLLVT